jgi:hypothetical protein
MMEISRAANIGLELVKGIGMIDNAFEEGYTGA